ncbi:hypothetical protein IAU60_001862 [Kwoniella sp. DSM 27419]
MPTLRPFPPLPSDIAQLLLEQFADLPRTAVRALAMCSTELHGRFAPVLFERVQLDKGNMRDVFDGLDPVAVGSRGPSHAGPEGTRLRGAARKGALLGHTRVLGLHDLPSLYTLARVLTACASDTSAKVPGALSPPPANSKPVLGLAITSTSPPQEVHPIVAHGFTPAHPHAVFPALTTLQLSGKAILALADIYNASTWSTSHANLPTNSILNALRDHLRPKRLILIYPECGYPPHGVGLHMHGCIEEVVGFLSTGWDLDTIEWKELPRSLVGPVPKATRLVYGFKGCLKAVACGRQHNSLLAEPQSTGARDNLEEQGDTTQAANAPPTRLKRSALPTAKSNSPSLQETEIVPVSRPSPSCGETYDYISLTAQIFAEHVLKRHSSGDEQVPTLEMSGLQCLFTLDWPKLVDEIWSRMGSPQPGDQEKIAAWKRASVVMTA